MAGERTLPGLGLRAYWTPGSNSWNTQHDPDTRTVSVLCQLAVKSRVATVPGSPVAGDIHILTSAPNQYSVAAYDNGAWVYYVPKEGWLAYDQGTDQLLLFNGVSWVSATGSSAAFNADVKTANYTTVDADFAGNKIIRMNLAGANTITIAPGMTNPEPLAVSQMGVGQTTIVAGAGVTLLSAGGALKLRVQYSVAAIMKVGTDTYLVSGDIVT